MHFRAKCVPHGPSFRNLHFSLIAVAAIVEPERLLPDSGRSHAAMSN
jgi:hypothetical protein